MTTADDATENKKRIPRTIFQVSSHAPLQPAVPAAPQKRKCTDMPFLILFSIFLLMLIPLSSVFSVGTNMSRFLYGYDKCGNTCGANNSKVHGINCSGQDMTQKPISQMKYRQIRPFCIYSKSRILSDKCVKHCEHPYRLIFHRCFPPDDITLDSGSKRLKQVTEVLHIFDQSLSSIVIMCLSGLVMTIGILVCFRCHVAATFWTLIIFQMIIIMTGTTFLWHKYITITTENYGGIYLLFALSTTAYLIFLLVFIIFLHNSFALTFQLYEEALSAIFRIPLLLLQPLITLFILLVTMISMIFLIFLISSNEYLVRSELDPSTFKYVPHFNAIFYAIYAAVMMLWIYGFAEGVQSMLISGAVASYYFAKNKFNLGSPYSNSFFVLLRYHLGTIACGSLTVTLFSMMRGISEYLVNNAYIQTAMHGTSLCKSNTYAIKLLGSNIINTITITGVNYIVMNGFSFLTMIISVVVGLWMNSDCDFTYYFWMGLLFGAVATGLVTFFVLGVLNMATATVYLCYCEEQRSNNRSNHLGDVSPSSTKKDQELEKNDRLVHI